MYTNLKGRHLGRRHLLPVQGCHAKGHAEGVCKLPRAPRQKELSSLLCPGNVGSPAWLLIGLLPDHASSVAPPTFRGAALRSLPPLHVHKLQM